MLEGRLARKMALIAGLTIASPGLALANPNDWTYTGDKCESRGHAEYTVFPNKEDVIGSPPSILLRPLGLGETEIVTPSDISLVTPSSKIHTPTANFAGEQISATIKIPNRGVIDFDNRGDFMNLNSINYHVKISPNKDVPNAVDVKAEMHSRRTVLRPSDCPK